MWSVTEKVSLSEWQLQNCCYKPVTDLCWQTFPERGEIAWMSQADFKISKTETIFSSSVACLDFFIIII